MAAFSNQATLTYNQTSVSSNVVTGEIIEVLSITKNALADSYSSGSEITYVLNLVNSGTVPFTDVTVTDDLGAYTFGTQTLVPLDYVEGSERYFVNGELQTESAAQVSGGVLTVSGISVPANGNSQIMYQTRVNSFAPLSENSTITNTASAQNGNAAAVTASETVAVSGDPILSIVKAVSPSTVPENGTLTYTFTISNTGNTAADAADNVSVTDIFSPVLDITEVTLNGTPLSQGTGYTYDQTTGEFATVPGGITVDAASYTQDPTTGEYSVIPGTAVLTVTGTV